MITPLTPSEINEVELIFATNDKRNMEFAQSRLPAGDREVMLQQVNLVINYHAEIVQKLRKQVIDGVLMRNQLAAVNVVIPREQMPIPSVEALHDRVSDMKIIYDALREHGFSERRVFKEERGETNAYRIWDAGEIVRHPVQMERLNTTLMEKFGGRAVSAGLTPKATGKVARSSMYAYMVVVRKPH